MVFILFTSDFFATFGALIAVGAQTNMLDENGNFPRIEKPFLVDAVGTVIGSGTGCTTISTFIESTIGVEAGGRTGLTAIVSGVLFLVCIFLSPLFLMIPTAVTGVALIFVGFSMLSGFTKLDFSDFKSCFGPFVMNPVRHLYRRHCCGDLPGRADGRADQGADRRCKEGTPGAVRAVYPAGAVFHRVKTG